MGRVTLHGSNPVGPPEKTWLFDVFLTVAPSAPFGTRSVQITALDCRHCDISSSGVVYLYLPDGTVEYYSLAYAFLSTGPRYLAPEDWAGPTFNYLNPPAQSPRPT